MEAHDVDKGEETYFSLEVLQAEDDDQPLKELLERFDLAKVMPYLKLAQVTYRSLEFLKAGDFQEIIPPVGLRVEFREKLFSWRKEKYGIDEDAMSMPSKVQDWLTKNGNSVSPPSLSPNNSSLPMYKVHFYTLHHSVEQGIMSLC